MNTQLLDVNWPFVLGTILFYKVYSLDHASTLGACPWYISIDSSQCVRLIVVGFTRIAVNFKFHSWIANLKLT